MTANERNWLIRTSQNQILGPVQKTKIIEFIQKGALGLNDEVTSGNGYWFLLREKDLVEKYIYGDLPQSYDPISEAKSILKSKINPNKTTSLNVSPTNNVTQVIDLKSLNFEDVVVPQNDDLEFPDVETIKASIEKEEVKDIKIPTNDDLEFPDITIVAKNVSSEMSLNQHSTNNDVTAFISPKKIEKQIFEEKNTDEVVIPNAADLEFPDMDFISDVKNKIADEIEVKFEVPINNYPEKNLNTDFKSNPSLNISSPGFGLPLELETKKDDERVEKNINYRPEKKAAISVYSRSDKQNEKSQDKSKNTDRPLPKINREISPELKNRNDTYLFIVLIVLVAIIIAIVFYYYRFILNRALPV